MRKTLRTMLVDGRTMHDTGQMTGHYEPWDLAKFRKYRSAGMLCTESYDLIAAQYAAEQVNANKTVAGRVEQARQLLVDGKIKTSDYLDILEGKPVVARKSFLTPELQQRLERTSRLIENRAREDATATADHTLSNYIAEDVRAAGLGALLGRTLAHIAACYAHPALIASIREYGEVWPASRPNRMDLVTWLKRSKLLEARR